MRILSYPLVARQHTTSGWKKPQQYLYHCNLTASKFRKSFLWSIGQNEGMWNTTCPHFPHIRLGLNPYREIVFRSTSQIAGARTVNRLFSPLSDVRKRKGLRISADPSSRMRKIGFVVVLLRGLLLVSAFLFSGAFWSFRPPLSGIAQLVRIWRTSGRGLRGTISILADQRGRLSFDNRPLFIYASSWPVWAQLNSNMP